MERELDMHIADDVTHHALIGRVSTAFIFRLLAVGCIGARRR